MTEREKRAARRRETLQGQLSRNGSHPGIPALSPELALAEMRRLTERLWRLSKQPMPEYARHAMPGRLIRSEA